MAETSGMGGYGGGFTPSGTPHYSGLAQYGYYNASRYMSKLDRQKSLAILGLLTLVVIPPWNALATPRGVSLSAGAGTVGTAGRVAPQMRYAAATRAAPSTGVASGHAMVLRANTLPVVSASSSTVWARSIAVSGPVVGRLVPAGIVWKGMMELAHLDSGIISQTVNDPWHNLLGFSRRERGGAREFLDKKSVALGRGSIATRFARSI